MFGLPPHERSADSANRLRQAAAVAAAVGASALAFLAGSIKAAPTEKNFGVMDDSATPGMIAGADYNLVKKLVWMTPTQRHGVEIGKKQLNQLGEYLSEAQQVGLRVVLEMYFSNPSQQPVRSSEQRDVCDVTADLVERFDGQIYGVETPPEPNNSQLWYPQFVDGKNVSAMAYEGLLKTCYAKIKAKDPGVVVYGGSLASSGEDNFRDPHSSTSPTLFINKMCDAYQVNGNSQPLMDEFDMHSYQNANPFERHPNSTTITIADYPKLDRLLNCFKPFKPKIWWGESGYNTDVTTTAQAYRYKGHPNPNVKTVDEQTQGQYYAEEVMMAYCQPDSTGLGLLHLIDDPELPPTGWSSGTYYALNNRHGTRQQSSVSLKPKRSAPMVEKALQAVANGQVDCSQLESK